MTPLFVAHQAPLSSWILQAGTLEWVAVSSSRGSSPTRDGTCVSRTAGGFLTAESLEKPTVRAHDTILAYVLPGTFGDF